MCDGVGLQEIDGETAHKSVTSVPSGRLPATIPREILRDETGRDGRARMPAARRPSAEQSDFSDAHERRGRGALKEDLITMST